MQGSGKSYWTEIAITGRSLMGGMVLTFSHLWNARFRTKNSSIQSPLYFSSQKGIATIDFPHHKIPVPDNGRYKLHNEIEDCIVCDKCVKVCPVNCITIEPIKSAIEFGRTSDNTPKRIYAGRFDINMGQCCFCGLCTTVCPTECLTMTQEYDFSVFNMKEHTFPFAEMSEVEISEKKKAWADHQSIPKENISTLPAASTLRQQFKPKIRPTPPPAES